MYVCVYERERKRERAKETERKSESVPVYIFFDSLSFDKIKNRNKQTSKQEKGEKWRAISYHKLYITEFKSEEIHFNLVQLIAKNFR